MHFVMLVSRLLFLMILGFESGCLGNKSYCKNQISQKLEFSDDFRVRFETHFQDFGGPGDGLKFDGFLWLL